MTEPLQTQPHRRKVNWALGLTVVALLAATLTALLSRPPVRQSPATSSASALVSVSRTNLVLVAGHLCLSGQTNGFHGTVLEHAPDGSLRSRTSVSNGWLHGLSEGWHTNGQLQVTEHFQAGVSHGLRTKWHPNGVRLSEGEIVDGKFHGTFRRWSANGTLTEQIDFVSGQADGFARAYFESGFLKTRARMKDGKVIEQQFWKDGEHRETAADLASSSQLRP